MPSKNNKYLSNNLSAFQVEYPLEQSVYLAGYSALIRAHNLKVPLARTLAAIGSIHKIYRKNLWQIYTPRHMPEASLEGHLTFALKYEGVNLVILKKLFESVSPEEIEAIVRAKPSSNYARRIWFFYEWLIEKELNLPDTKTANYVDALDSKLQFAANKRKSRRHRVNNNLPGTREFCPLVFRTKTIEGYIKSNLIQESKNVLGNISGEILKRTISFLVLKDSKSSYAIENERPSQNRLERWTKVVSQAGQNPMSLDELLCLQKVVMGDNPFLTLGLRTKGGFVGRHERISRRPIPEHISAKAKDLPKLIQGLLDFEKDFASNLDPVIAASVLAFGFIYIHPFEDGNGRLHRYLIHHVLAQHGFNPKGIIFPISAVILEQIDNYREVLESYSKNLLQYIDWETTEEMNVNVLNDTADFYRYFDATQHVEFLYSCIKKTIEVDLPQEAKFLSNYDIFQTRIEALLEMPSRMIDLLFSFLEQNDGKLSQRALNKEFTALKSNEISYIEKTYAEIFKT